MKAKYILMVFVLGVFPSVAMAASLEGTLTSLVNSFIGRILPILALGYLGKNIFAHIQSDPNAKNETPRVVIACTLLLIVNAVWQYLRDNIH